MKYKGKSKTKACSESLQSAVKTLPDGANDMVNEGTEGEKINLRELTGCLTQEYSPKSLVSASDVHAESSSHGGYALIMCLPLCSY